MVFAKITIKSKAMIVCTTSGSTVLRTELYTKDNTFLISTDKNLFKIAMEKRTVGRTRRQQCRNCVIEKQNKKFKARIASFPLMHRPDRCTYIFKGSK